MIVVGLGARQLTESLGPVRRLDPVGLISAAAVFVVTDALLRGA